MVNVSSTNQSILELTSETAKTAIANSNKLLIIDFYAEWCGPCKTLAPIFQEVSEELKDQYTFAKINIDNCQEIAKELQIVSIPTIMIFHNGKVIDKTSGMITKKILLEKIEQALNGPQDLTKLPKDALNEKLFQAIQSGDSIDEIKKILYAGADVNYKVNDLPMIMMAIIMNASRGMNASELIKTLLSYGASTEFIDKTGNTVKIADFIQIMGQNHKNIAAIYDTMAQIFNQ